MTEYDRMISYSLLTLGSVFRLMADGAVRICQVEIGAVLWELPRAVTALTASVEQIGWLEELGPSDPWIAERTIGMQTFPGGMGTLASFYCPVLGCCPPHVW